MKFKNNNETVTFRGVEFPKGKAVEITDPNFIEKLKNIPGFSIVKAKSNAKNKD